MSGREPGPGQLAVAIHSSDPDWGDPETFIFFMEPPVRPVMLHRKRREMCKVWVRELGKRGKTLQGVKERNQSGQIRSTGPYNFRHDERVDLSDKHQGDLEYHLDAWFTRDKPLIVAAGVIDMWHERRKRFGYETHDPSLRADGDPTPSAGFDTRNHPFGE